MKQFFCVLNSNAINRYGYQISTGALVSGTHKTSLVGIPSLIAHDHSRPIGWIFPMTVYMEPGLTRAAGFGWFPDTEDEKEKMGNQYKYHYHETYIKPTTAYFNQLAIYLKDFLLGQERKVVCESAAFYEPGLALRAFPELFKQQDKDGLVPLNNLSPIGAGVYQIGELVVFAHSYFRRSLYRLNSLNYPLLTELQSMSNAGVNVKLAIDPDMVGLAEAYMGEKLELQYWWGPKFNDDLTSIPRGVTHHEASESDRIFFGISAMQFRWGAGGEHHIFEAEELRNLPSKIEMVPFYGCRYVHSMVDVQSGNVVHLDGAIRSYSEEKMLQRLEMKLDQAPRDTEYTKLWRVDSSLTVDRWKRLVSDYYRDNYLVGEYFGAEDEAVEERNGIKGEQSKSLLEEYVPYSMNVGSGVRIALSFSDITRYAGMNSPRVIAFDSISTEESSQAFIESCGLELKKILKKHGIDLIIPTEVQYVHYKDFYVNLPLIYHDDHDITGSLHQTLTAISELLKVWIGKKLDRVICYKIGFPVDDGRAAIVSVLGHIEDMVKWLSCDLCCPPATLDELNTWADQTTEYLTKTFTDSVDKPPLSEVLMHTGLLLINRQPISYSSWKLNPHDENEQYMWSLLFPEDRTELAHRLQAVGVVPGLGFVVTASRCTKCGSDYRYCDCSKSLDDEVSQEIQDMIPLVPFWTDRPMLQVKPIPL